MKHNLTFTALSTQWQIKVITLLLLLCSATTLHAQTFTSGGFKFIMNEYRPGTVAISQVWNNAPTGAITIPSEVTYNNIVYPVSRIDGYAFQYSGITAVTIPNSVIDILDYAFSECNLTSIVIPDSVIFIGNNAFFNCPN